MSSERRRQSRKIPQSFTFLQLENDDGGHVVNLSEEGLCFESFSPVRTANPVPLWFSFNLRDRIEATGQVVWTDPKNEIGGLAFINLSPAAREQIRCHIAEFPPEEAVPPAGRTSAEKPRLLSLLSSKKARLAVVPRPSETRLLEIPVTITSESPAREPALTEASVSAGHAPLVLKEHVASALRSQFLRGLLLGILIATLIAIPVFEYALHSQRNDAGRGVSTPGSPANGGMESAPQAAKPAPDPSPAAPPKSPSASSTRDSSADAAAAAPPSSGASVHAKPTPTPDDLWDAVQSGNAQAAVALADLYLRGDGVPVNCAQARILLQFAAQKNNPEAAKKARELDKSGCPTR